MRLPRYLATLLLAGAALFGLTALGPAQNAKDDKKEMKKDEEKKTETTKDETREEVQIPTYDGVTLKGSYYRGTKGTNSPVVLFLHKYGSDRTKGDWDALAKRFQKKGFAILAIDFRGHGLSKTVDPDLFFKVPANARNVKRGKTKDEVEKASFGAGYFPMLVNDLAAARKFLDERNDARECNVANLFVVADGDAAWLTFLWAAAEWNRDPLKQGVLGLQVPTDRKAGQDLSGLIFLSYQKNVPGGSGGNPAAWVKLNRDFRDKTPMVFLYGGEDTTGKADASYMFNTVLNVNSKSASLPKIDKITFDFPIKEAGKVRGIELLGKGSTPAEDLIEKFVDAMLEKKGSVTWKEREAAKVEKPYPVPLARFGINGLS